MISALVFHLLVYFVTPEGRLAFVDKGGRGDFASCAAALTEAAETAPSDLMLGDNRILGLGCVIVGDGKA